MQRVPTSLFLKNGEIDNTPIGISVPREGNFSIINSAVVSTNQLYVVTKHEVNVITDLYKGDIICDNVFVKTKIGSVYGEIRNGKFSNTRFTGYIFSNGILKVSNGDIFVITGVLKDCDETLFDVINYHKASWPKKAYANTNSILPNAEFILLSGSGGVVMLGPICEFIKTIIGRNIGSPILIKELGIYISDKEIVKVIYDGEWIRLF